MLREQHAKRREGRCQIHLKRVALTNIIASYDPKPTKGQIISISNRGDKEGLERPMHDDSFGQL